MARKMRWKSIFSVAAIFLAFGPPIGSLVVIAAFVTSAGGTADASLSAGEFVNAAAATLGLVFPMSYIVGGIPAGLTGLICAALSPWIRSLRDWLPITTLIGFLTSAIPMAFFSSGSGDPAGIAVVGAAGALAGLSCGWFTRNLRATPLSRD